VLNCGRKRLRKDKCFLLTLELFSSVKVRPEFLSVAAVTE